jgi:hypothetical protein
MERKHLIAVVMMGWFAAYMIFRAAQSVNSGTGEVMAVACGFAFQFAAILIYAVSRATTELKAIRAALETQRSAPASN